MLTFLRRAAMGVLISFACTYCLAQNIRPYTQVFSQNLKGGTAIFGNTTMQVLNSNGHPYLAVHNESGNAANGVGGLGYASYGNDDFSMEPAMVDAAVPIFTVFTNGSAWNYNRPNSDQGTAWRTLTAPPAAAWVSGTGSFGYGLTQTITIPSGHVTDYFLKTINIANLALYTGFNFTLSYDDGAVVYVNGVEVKRYNMPAGVIAYGTLATTGNTTYNATFSIPASAFVSGNNVIAVEVHQRIATSPGCIFDMSLTATPFVPSNATSADLVLPAGTNTIKFARLYWGGRLDNSAVSAGTDTLRKIKIRKGAAGEYTSLIAPATSTDQYIVSSLDVLYQSYVDITAYVQANGAGTYTVANVPTTPGYSYTAGGQYGGWCIMIAYENTALPYNSVRIYDGFSQVYDSGIPVSQTVVLSGLNIPNNALALNDAVMSTMVWEGDANLGESFFNPLGDYVKINGIRASNAVNPISNFWNGTISKNGAFVTTKNPNYTNQFGIDIDELPVGTGYGILPNATSVTIQFGTEADQYFPSVFGFSVRMKDPVLTMDKTVTDASGNGQVESSEVLTYTLVGTNSGSGASYNTFIIDSLPTNVTYVANSLKINSAPGFLTPTLQTDLLDLDFALKGNVGLRNYVKFFLGIGATAVLGGTMNAGTSYSVSFKVKAGVIPGSITNTARVTSNSQAGDTFNDDGTAIIAPAAGPLAVKLTAFTATLVNNTESLLKWSTENELNNDHFETERSEDGVHFIFLGNVTGSGTTATVHNYTYTDHFKTAAAVVYYRLKIVDVDGEVTYSKIVALRLKGAMSDSFTAYPNPFNDDLKILLAVSQDVSTTFRIISFDGKEITNQKILLQSGENIVVLKDLSHLAHGSYILEVNTGTDKLIRKIVKN